MWIKLATLVGLLAGSAAAAPIQDPASDSTSLAARALPADAPYSQPASTYIAALQCPNGIQNKTGGIVFLVHGTGSTGNETWGNGPYNLVLPTKGVGYDICWVNLPNQAMGDAQLSAEYVAYLIGYLASLSPGSNHKINLVGHSQGAGFNPQWALTFWPSRRQYIINYIALAGDFHGTEEGTFYCTGGAILGGGCQPSVWQQSIPSNYLSAQNSNADSNSGAQALVPTTSVYTYYDDVIQPEYPPSPTSALPGAAVFALQDPTICGPTHLADHFYMPVDPAAFELAYEAISTGAPATAAGFNHAYCTYLVDNTSLNLANVAAQIEAAALAAYAIGSYPRVTSEPPLQPYVCSRGYATTCGAAGFPGGYD